MRYIWLPIVAALYAAQAYLSWRSNGGSWKWTAGLYVLSIVSLWPFIARYSDDVAGDALLFDSTMLISFSLVAIAMGAEQMTATRWAAAGMVVGGLVLWRVSGCS